MKQRMAPLFEADGGKVAVGSTPDPEVATLPKRRLTGSPTHPRTPREWG